MDGRLTAPAFEEASMRRRERGRRTSGAALVLAVVCGATSLSFGGCGQSGPLHRPEKVSLAAGVTAPSPVARPKVPAGRTGTAAFRGDAFPVAAARFARA